MKKLLSFFNRSFLLYLAIFAIAHFYTNVDTIQKQRLWYLNNSVNAVSGRINYKVGVIFFDYLTYLRPHNAEAWANLGVCQVHLGEFESAIASYKKALSFASDNPQYLEDLMRIESALAAAKKH